MIQILAIWWAIFGIITVIIGFYRYFTLRTDEPSELIIMSWFFFPMIYLPVFIIRTIQKYVRRNSK